MSSSSAARSAGGGLEPGGGGKSFCGCSEEGEVVKALQEIPKPWPRLCKYRRWDGSKLLYTICLKVTFLKIICLILGTPSEYCGLRVQFHTSVNAGNGTKLLLGYAPAVT